MKWNCTIVIIIGLLYSATTSAQSWQWAFTEGLPPRSQAVTAKEDKNGNIYTASYTDSVNSHISAQLIKRDVSQQWLWKKQFKGNVKITDLEIDATDHILVVGCFTGNVTFEDTTLSSITPVDNSGFILKVSDAGIIQWVHVINPVNGNFEPNDLFIATNGKIFLTSDVSGSFGFCAFHQLDANGNILVSEFNNNFNNRTFSHIITDDADNMYLSGTCGDHATFDTITSNPTFSYQNFLVKYDSNFVAQWLITREYVTFDNNNSLTSDGNLLYWAFNEFTSGSDTTKVIKCDVNGQIQKTFTAPLSSSFFPTLSHVTNKDGNSVLLINVYSRIFVYLYDNAFNVIWQDTIYTGISGTSMHPGITLMDSSFLITGIYIKDTLMLDNLMLLNPNTASNFPSDIFVAHWEYGTTSGIEKHKRDDSIIIYPNPAKEELNVVFTEQLNGLIICIFDALGKLIYTNDVTSTNMIVNISAFNNGLYFFQLLNKSRQVEVQRKFIILR